MRPTDEDVNSWQEEGHHTKLYKETKRARASEAVLLKALDSLEELVDFEPYTSSAEDCNCNIFTLNGACRHTRARTALRNVRGGR